MKFIFSIPTVPLKTILLLSLTEFGDSFRRKQDKGTKCETSFFAIQIVASIVEILIDSARGKKYFSYEFKRIKFN